MAQKPKTYWTPEAKGHLAAAHLLSKNAPNLGKSAPVVQHKLASFRAAAKVAQAKQPAPKPLKVLKTVNSMTPEASSPTPAAKPVIQPLKASPLKTGLPSKLPGA